jgi:flagellar hook protein FlgE
MGLFGAMTTAVGGLRAQAFALENVSGNIANSQTTGFKRVDTTFSDLVPDSAPQLQLAGGVIARSRGTNNVQGDIQNASVDTFMAINGDGYFVVQKPSAFPDGQPVFTGVDLFSRRGDFQLDKDGYLVNGTGYYLKVLRVDGATGNVIGSIPEVMQFSNDFLPAQPTTLIEYRANLASYPRTGASDPDVPQSELLDPADFTVDPTVAGTGTVVADDAATFLSQSISGGAITAFTSLGSPVNVQLRWAKIDAATYGGTDEWELFYLEDSNATGAAVAWRNAGVTYSFDASGQLTPPISSVTLTGFTINGVPLEDTTVSHGANGITQFADVNGNAQVNLLRQNGYPAGELQTISVNEKGRVIASYSNGRTLEMAEIVLASFNADNALKRLDGGAFEATSESGPPQYGASGKIIGKSLEGSNTDIADEFTKLIVTQQAYAANTRIVTTSDQMLQETLNMVR